MRDMCMREGEREREGERASEHQCKHACCSLQPVLQLSTAGAEQLPEGDSYQWTDIGQVPPHTHALRSHHLHMASNDLDEDQGQCAAGNCGDAQGVVWGTITVEVSACMQHKSTMIKQLIVIKNKNIAAQPLAGLGSKCLAS